MGERMMSAPTIERGRRCQNCKHWNNGDIAIQHYKSRRFQDLQYHAARILEGETALPVGMTRQRLGDFDIHSPKIAGARSTTSDFSELDAQMKALGLNYELGDTLMRAGLMGICMVAACLGDFVHRDYFCGTRYEPRVVVDDAGKPDETPDEARDRLGLKDD